MDTDWWIKVAIESISKIEEGKCFIVKGLFQGYSWDTLQNGEKRYFGKVFKNTIQEKQIDSIICIGKKQNNSTLYKKI